MLSPVLKPLLTQSFRSSGIYLLIIALVLAISATTAVKFSNQQVQQAVALQAAEMLAADLVLSDTAPLEQKWFQQARQLGLAQSKVTVFSSMVHTDDQFVMVNVKAIDQAFPLRGELQSTSAAQTPNPGEVWLSPRALELLKVKVGDQIQIADGSFNVAAKIVKDSNQELGFSGFSPTVIIHQQDIARTEAIQVGSRVQYRLLMAGSPQQVQAFEKGFEQLTGQKQKNKIDTEQAGETTSLQLRNAGEANTRLMKPLENLDTFLQLANILTILLCGIAIALTSQRYVMQNQDHLALLRCLGASKHSILWAYLILLVIIMLIAISFGAILGIGLGYGLLQLMLQLIPNLNIQFSVLAMLQGPLPVAMFTSAIVLLGFIGPSLWQLLNTPPIRVIRQQEKSVVSILVMLSTGLLSLVIFSVVLTENLRLTAWVMLAIILLCTVLYGLVWLILKILKAAKGRISAYVRTPYQTALQITALALGLSLITVLAVLRTDMLERWQQQLPVDTPNQFVYGLPPFDLEPFQQQVRQNGWAGTALYPNIRGRLTEKNGQPFSSELIQKSNSLQRELNLTQTKQYPADNRIIEGAASFSRIGQVSVEAKTAEELGIRVGDELGFSLPEGLLKARVINLRTVEWESFSPNFFFIFSPDTIDENAGSYLGSFYVPEEDRPKLVNLIQQFPNTVFIDVSMILEQVKQLVNVLVQIITVLAVLVSISGFLVLLACLNLLLDERKQEVALLRSFGSSKHKLKQMLSLEIGLIGFISGAVACLFAEVISAIASYRMELPIQLHAEIWLCLPLVMTVVCAIIGRYRLSYLCDIPPLESLRSINQ